MIRMLMIVIALVLPGLVASAPAALQAQGTPAAAQDSRTAPLNLNVATAAELERLPGVGPAMAARIVEYRQKNGPFKKIEEIIERPRSCPCLLGKGNSWSVPSVSLSRQNPQQISQSLASGGRSGGRTCHFSRTRKGAARRFGTEGSEGREVGADCDAGPVSHPLGLIVDSWRRSRPPLSRSPTEGPVRR